jgi:hypothetical protein
MLIESCYYCLSITVCITVCASLCVHHCVCITVCASLCVHHCVHFSSVDNFNGDTVLCSQLVSVVPCCVSITETAVSVS